MARIPQKVDALDILGRLAQQRMQSGERGPRPGVWNPMLHGAPNVEQAPFIGDQPGFPGAGIDPVAAQGIVRLGLEDPDRFAMVMASTGAPPPVMPKAQDRLESSTMPEPRRVQTETIRPQQKTPAQRITDAFINSGIGNQVNEPLPPGQRLQVEPGATAHQSLGDLLAGRQPELIAGPAPEPVLGRMLENERVTAPDVIAPPVQVPEVDLANPVPIEQQQGEMVPPVAGGGQVATGANQGLANLGQALLGVKAPEEPRVPAPMPAPAAPRPSQPIQPSATLMSLLLGSLGRGRQMPLRVGG